jgi:hypothetical protein
MATSNSCNLFVSDTYIHKNVTGIRVSSTAGFAVANIRHCYIEGNTNGVDAAAANSFVSVSDSRISNNSGLGVATTAATANLTVSHSTISNNGTGISAAASSSVRALSNDVLYNGTGFGGTTAVIQTDAQNRNAGNTTPGAPGGGTVTIH